MGSEEEPVDKAMQLRSGKRANRLRELHEALVVRPEGSLW
jgi:hypothetical protein